LAQCHVELGDWQASMRSEDEPVRPHICFVATADLLVGSDRVDP
jgi:hypothetical protein